jgi:predicted GH43/DUF377 family glycosyl hydrolase
MWPLGPFRKRGRILAEHPSLPWASKDLFNPGAVVHNGRVHLLVRGEDHSGRFAGTSRIGLAVSDDGIDFRVEPEPVIQPGNDEWQDIERGGGCEDPRVVETHGGQFVCTYTGFDGRVPTLMVATSADLQSWTKHGPAFADTAHVVRSSKSGAILTEVVDGRLVAARVADRYWMYWGEGICFAATSTDLVRWRPVEYDATGDRYLTYATNADGTGHYEVHRVPGHRVLRPVLFPRHSRFDSLLVEPGPPAVRTDDGIVLMYNGADAQTRAYQPGQALFDAVDPLACVARTSAPFLSPDTTDERDGQVANVCFAQSLVLFDGNWFLYYGMADSRIGCATAPLIG